MLTNLTKEDYMKLPKEKLAELLVEREKLQPMVVPITTNLFPCCIPGGVCTNPHHDCINCPRPFGDIRTITTTNTMEIPIGHKPLNAEDVIEWLRFHIQVDEPKIEYNEEGQPLAESFLAHAEERCTAADEVVNKFRQDFGL